MMLIFLNQFLASPVKKRISSHENKKALSKFYHKKIFLIENKFIFYQKYFHDKMGLRIFYFRATISKHT